MMARKRSKFGLAFAIFLALSVILPVAADQPPRLPSAFYGTVTDNGQNVPNGTPVSAWINGVKYAETTTFMTTINSQQVSVYTLTVPGDDPSTPDVIEGGNEGDTIVFRVNGYLTHQTGVWHEGTDVELNLTVNYAPSAVSVTPSAGSAMPTYFNPFYSAYEDPNGWNDLRDVYLMWNTEPTENIQQLRYDVLNNKLYIRNDENTEWIGGFAPGTNVQLTNSNITLDVSQTTVVTTAIQVRITWRFAAKQPTTSVNWKSYLKAVDSGSQSTGWVSRGTRRINMFPNVGGLTPASGTATVGTPQVFTATYSDEDGTSTLTNAYIRVTMQTSPYTEQFRACYKAPTNEVLVYNGSAWLGPLQMGQPGTLETDYVRLDVGASSASTSAKVLTVNWSLTFKPGSEGSKDIWGYIYDKQNFQDGFLLIGQWTVGSGGAAFTRDPGAPPDPGIALPPGAAPGSIPSFRSTSVYSEIPSGGFIAPTRYGKAESDLMPPPIDISPLKPSTAVVGLSPRRAPSPNDMPVIGIFGPPQSNGAAGWGWNFRAQVSDPAGYAHLSQVYVLFSLDGSTRNAIYIRYDQNTNRVYLRDSDDTTWLGGYTPGTGVKISNRNGTLDVALTRAVPYATYYLDVYPQVIFKETGTSQHYRIFVMATDDSGNSTGWVEKGWRRINLWPGVGGVTPSSNVHQAGTTQSYTTTFTDPQSWQGLKYVYINVASTPGGASQSLYAAYIVATNEIKMRKDDGTWTGPITPGSAQDLSNSWVTIHGEGCSVTKSGDKVTVTWSLEFKSSLAGTTKNVYLYAQDTLDWIDFWRYAGTIQITP